MPQRLIDLVGQKFGRLTVIEQGPQHKSGSRWICKCSCGGSKIVFSISLRNGSTSHCGCGFRRNRSAYIPESGNPHISENPRFRLSAERPTSELSPGGASWIKQVCSCGHNRIAHNHFYDECQWDNCFCARMRPTVAAAGETCHENVSVECHQTSVSPVVQSKRRTAKTSAGKPNQANAVA